MASENEVGIGFAARDSGFVSVMQQMIEATQNLTSSITGLNNILTGNASALNAVEQAHQKSATSTLADVTSIQSLTNAETSAGAASQTRLAQLMQEADQRERVASMRQQLASRATEEVNVTNQEGEAVQTLIMRHGGLVDVIDRETGSVITSTAAGQAAIAVESSRTEQLLAQVAAMNNVAESENRDAVSAELLAKSQDELNQMVAAGVITGEQYRAILDSQIDARARETAATVQQTAVQTEQNNALSQSWEKVMMTMGKTGTESPAIALEAINVAAANGVAPLTMQKQLLQERFTLVQQWIQSGEVVTWQELNTKLKELDQTTNGATMATRAHITETRGARFEVMALMMVMMEFNTVMDGSSKNMTIFREGTMAMANSLMVFAMIPGPLGMALAAFTASIALLGMAAKVAADPNIDALNKQLDTLGAKDDAVAGLMAIAQVTRDDAQAAMDYMKANAAAADEFKNLIDQQRGGIPVLQGIGDAFRAEVVNIEAATTGARATIAELGAFNSTLNQTHDMAQAAAAGLQAYTDTMRGYTDEQMKARQALIDGDAALQKNALDFKDLESALSSVAKHTDAATLLSQIALVSKDQAAAVLDSVSKHKELGAQLDADIILYHAAKDAVDKANAAHINNAQAIIAEGEAARRVSDDIKALNEAEVISAATEANKKIAEDRQKFADDSIKAARDLADQLKEIDYQRGQAVIKLSQENAKAQEEYNNTVFKDSRDLNDALFKASRDLTDAMIDDAQRLADSQFKANRTLNDSLADLAYQHNKQEQDIANQNVTNQRNAANDIYRAYRDMLQSLADSDWNTSQDLQNAKTENERNQIEQRAMHERAGIREKFGNTVEDINTRITEENRLSKIKEDLADQDYQHSIMVDQRKNAEALADAQRTYNEEVERAKRRDDEMVADARTRNQEQLDDAIRALNAKFAANQLALDNENKALDHQVELDKQRNAERLSDLQKTLNEEIKAVVTAVSLEVQAYMVGLQMYKTVMTQIAAEQATLTSQGASQLQEQLNISNPNFTQKLPPGGTDLIKQLTGKEEGGSVTAGQAYIVGESGKELFIPQESGTIIPNSMITNNSAYTALNSEEIQTQLQTINNIGGNESFLNNTFNQTIGGASFTNLSQEQKDVLVQLISGQSGGSTGITNQVFNQGNILNQITGRESGGNVMAGQPYVVGESGRELFVPHSSATSSVSNSYGGHTFNINITSNDPDYIWEQFKKRLNQETWRP